MEGTYTPKPALRELRTASLPEADPGMLGTDSMGLITGRVSPGASATLLNAFTSFGAHPASSNPNPDDPSALERQHPKED